jgi:recombination protein RecA
MPSASTIRLQIETALAHRIPTALSPAPKVIRPVYPTGISAIDVLLDGGLPVGAITEMTGPECSGRTSLALSFLAGISRSGSVAAWIDVSDAWDPESAASSGVELSRVLWVRCGVLPRSNTATNRDPFRLPKQYMLPPPIKKGLHGGGFGPHPRTEVKGLSNAVSELFRHSAIAPRCAEPQPRMKPQKQLIPPVSPSPACIRQSIPGPCKPWAKIEQALRVVDLLLQAGGFAAVVLDMAGIAPEYASRVPLATWFRYRAAAERTRASLLLLTQYPCAKSSSELLLRFKPGVPCQDETTVFTGMEYRLEVERRRFNQPESNIVEIRKPPTSEKSTHWHVRATCAGER